MTNKWLKAGVSTKLWLDHYDIMLNHMSEVEMGDEIYARLLLLREVEKLDPSGLLPDIETTIQFLEEHLT